MTEYLSQHGVPFLERDITTDPSAVPELIAAGALLPGIGGVMAKAGVIEGLYVGELLGLILIWAGYACCVRPQAPGPATGNSAALESPADPA